MDKLLELLNELKGGLENLSDSDLLEARMKLVELVNDSIEIVNNREA